MPTQMTRELWNRRRRVVRPVYAVGRPVLGPADQVIAAITGSSVIKKCRPSWILVNLGNFPKSDCGRFWIML